MMRLFALGFVLIGCTGFLCAQDAPEQVVDTDTTPYHLALLAYKSGHFDVARTEIDAAEKASPNDMPTVFLKVKILTEQHDFAAAEKLLRSLYAPADVSQVPQDANAVAVELALGDLLLRKHSFDRAAKYYLLALQVKPDDPDIILKLVYTKIGSGDLIAAGQYASELKPIDPKNPYDSHASYFFAKAALAQATQRTADAEEDIENARTIYGNTITDRYLKLYLEVFAPSNKSANSDLVPPPLVKPTP